MANTEFPTAIVALDAAPRTKPSNYPEPFASRMAGRVKRALGDIFGLSNFGVNLTRLIPGACSATLIRNKMNSCTSWRNSRYSSRIKARRRFFRECAPVSRLALETVINW